MDVESAPERKETPFSIKTKTPARLSAMPKMPLQVILSLMTIADMINVIMGLIVFIIDASMAVVWVIAKRNESCVMNRPRNEAIITFQMSFLSICSRGAVKRDQIQNNAVAPNDRKQNNAIGVIFPSMAILLQLMRLKPKMAYAVKHARFPIRVLFFSCIISLFAEDVCVEEVGILFLVKVGA